MHIKVCMTSKQTYYPVGSRKRNQELEFEENLLRTQSKKKQRNLKEECKDMNIEHRP